MPNIISKDEFVKLQTKIRAYQKINYSPYALPHRFPLEDHDYAAKHCRSLLPLLQTLYLIDANPAALTQRHLDSLGPEQADTRTEGYLELKKSNGYNIINRLAFHDLLREDTVTVGRIFRKEKMVTVLNPLLEKLSQTPMEEIKRLVAELAAPPKIADTAPKKETAKSPSFFKSKKKKTDSDNSELEAEMDGPSFSSRSQPYLPYDSDRDARKKKVEEDIEIQQYIANHHAQLGHLWQDRTRNFQDQLVLDREVALELQKDFMRHHAEQQVRQNKEMEQLLQYGPERDPLEAMRQRARQRAEEKYREPDRGMER